MVLIRILLHSCCAPCSVSVIDHLKKAGFSPTVFWFNPNIHPYTEFRMRKKTLEQFSQLSNLEFVDGGSYDIQKFLLDLNGEFRFKFRCEICYFLRLRACVNFAKEKGFEFFSTTLLVSPFQNHEQIKKQAFDLAKVAGLRFHYFDFRPFFKQGQQKAIELGLYMQKYCGCVFSEEERFSSRARKRVKRQIRAE